MTEALVSTTIHSFQYFTINCDWRAAVSNSVPVYSMIKTMYQFNKLLDSGKDSVVYSATLMIGSSSA